jgi:hypothetical protein
MHLLLFSFSEEEQIDLLEKSGMISKTGQESA